MFLYARKQEKKKKQEVGIGVDEITLNIKVYMCVSIF